MPSPTNKQRERQRSKMRDIPLTAERVRALLRYSPEDGGLYWIANPRFSSGFVGRRAGSMRKDGYWGIAIDGRQYLLHRVVWLHQRGEWPRDGLDHINRDRADSRLENLREATNYENQQNSVKARALNKSSGLIGVWRWTNPERPWQAGISINGKRIRLGYFATKEEAHAAYLAAKREVHPFYAP